MNQTEETPTTVENTQLETYLQNIKSQKYLDYLDNFKKTLEDRNKCFRSKKCAFEFDIDSKKIVKKKDSKIIYQIDLPQYIMVNQRLSEIRKQLRDIESEIKMIQPTISLDSPKKLIEKYKSLRKDFISLEKEETMLIEYLFKVNQVEERTKKKQELENKLIELESIRRKLFEQINLMYLLKETKDFDKKLYEEKIKEYLNTNELEKVRTEIKKCDSFQLKTDELFFNEHRKELGKIDYIIEKLPNLKKGSGGKSIKIKK